MAAYCQAIKFLVKIEMSPLVSMMTFFIDMMLPRNGLEAVGVSEPNFFELCGWFFALCPTLKIEHDFNKIEIILVTSQ